MFLDTILIVIGNIVFLYLFWKRLREDYVSDQIFVAAFYIITFVVINNLIIYRYNLSLWFWGSFLGSLMGLAVSVIRFRFRLPESLEALVISLLPVYSLYLLGSYIDTENINYLFSSLVVVLLFAGFFVVDKHYKKLVWYKSGRVGFSGLSVLGVFFLLRAAVAPLLPTVLSFFGNLDIILSSLVAFLAFLGVYNLART